MGKTKIEVKKAKTKTREIFYLIRIETENKKIREHLENRKIYPSNTKETLFLIYTKDIEKAQNLILDLQKLDQIRFIGKYKPIIEMDNKELKKFANRKGIDIYPFYDKPTWIA